MAYKSHCYIDMEIEAIAGNGGPTFNFGILLHNKATGDEAIADLYIDSDRLRDILAALKPLGGWWGILETWEWEPEALANEAVEVFEHAA